MDLGSCRLHSCRRDVFDRAVIEEGCLATSSALLVPLEGSFVVLVTLVFVTLVFWTGVNGWYCIQVGPAVAVLADCAETLDRSSNFAEVVPMRLGASASW
jgi:hypothetical protein